jgi:ubiquinone/menaquinone biosynthesis C-methylase UbiE
MDSGKNLDSDYVKSYYNRFLSTYDKEYAYYRWKAGPVERLHYTQTKRALLPYLKKLDGMVLEIGGGDGIWTQDYVSRIDALSFLDISKEMVARAQKRLEKYSEKITYVNEDFLHNKFAAGTFDHIVSIRNLEYFTDKNKFISEVHRLLKHKGTFVLVTKSPQYDLKDNAKGKALHTGQIDIKDLIVLIEKQGMKVLSVRPAIFGKLFRFPLMRFISNIIHSVVIAIPWKWAPLRLFSYLSESFVVYVQK